MARATPATFGPCARVATKQDERAGNRDRRERHDRECRANRALAEHDLPVCAERHQLTREACLPALREGARRTWSPTRFSGVCRMGESGATWFGRRAFALSLTESNSVTGSQRWMRGVAGARKEQPNQAAGGARGVREAGSN